MSVLYNIHTDAAVSVDKPMVAPTHVLHLFALDLTSPMQPEVGEHLQRTSPALFVLRRQWDAFWEQMAHTKSPASRQRVLVHYLREQYALPERMSTAIIYARLQAQIKTALASMERLFDRYLPHGLRRQLRVQSQKCDPCTLIECGMPSTEGVPRDRFEAQRALVMGLLWFDITIDRWIGHDHAYDASQLTLFLLENKILIEAPEEHVLLSFHDPNREYYCAGIERFQEPTSQIGLIAISTRVRIAKLRTQNKAIPILYDARIKDPMSILRRMLIDGQWNPRWVRDVRAFRFCYLHEGDILVGYPSVANRLLPGSLGLVKDSFTTNQPLNPNRHSAETFRDIKYVARIRNTLYEVQHLLASTRLNIEYAHGPINHDLYNARQMCEMSPPGLFHCLAPTHIYGINWTSEKTQQQIASHILGSFSR